MYAHAQKKNAGTSIILVLSLYHYFRLTGSSTSQDASFRAVAKAVEAAEKESIKYCMTGKEK